MVLFNPLNTLDFQCFCFRLLEGRVLHKGALIATLLAVPSLGFRTIKRSIFLGRDNSSLALKGSRYLVHTQRHCNVYTTFILNVHTLYRRYNDVVCEKILFFRTHLKVVPFSSLSVQKLFNQSPYFINSFFTSKGTGRGRKINTISDHQEKHQHQRFSGRSFFLHKTLPRCRGSPHMSSTPKVV